MCEAWLGQLGLIGANWGSLIGPLLGWLSLVWPFLVSSLSLSARVSARIRERSDAYSQARALLLKRVLRRFAPARTIVLARSTASRYLLRSQARSPSHLFELI
jgi:hypothetical protein